MDDKFIDKVDRSKIVHTKPHRFVRLGLQWNNDRVEFEVEWLRSWTTRKIHSHPEWTEDMVRKANEIADDFERRNKMEPDA